MSSFLHGGHPKWNPVMPLDFRTIGFMVMAGSLLSIIIGAFTVDIRPFDPPAFIEIIYFLLILVSFPLLPLWWFLFQRRYRSPLLIGVVVYSLLLVFLIFAPPGI